MSDLCPVYAPFFGAMVSFTTNFMRSPDTTVSSFSIGLYQCYRVYVYAFSRCLASLYLINLFHRYWSKVSFFVEAPRVFTAFAIAALNPQLIDFTPQLWDRKIWCWHFSHGCITA